MELITAGGAPAAVGPYSHASRLGDLIFCSGQIPLDPATGEIVVGGIEAQTKQVLLNLAAVLEEAGSSLQHVAKTTIYLTDMADFPTVNAIYAEAFKEHKPARATVAVAGLPLGVEVEIDCIAAPAE